MLPYLERAGEWFLRSGIQLESGGVARYYRADTAANAPVSTEITGYTLSTLVYLYSLTGDQRFLERAALTARFLAGTAWDAANCVMPFELDPPAHTYFFDCGIVIRGLLAAWRATGTEQFLAVAALLGETMSRDFAAAKGEFHPVIALPQKHPADRVAGRWSRMPGCYQLKSGMALWDLAEATGDHAFSAPYNQLLDAAMADSASFLPGHTERARVMDRLHAYLYFLEGLLPCTAASRCASLIKQGIQRVAGHLREIAPEFDRSDVYAQLLRIRMYASDAGVVPVDRAEAQHEADQLLQFQISSDDPRLDGGFYFGRVRGEFLPHANPVSTAFALQALALWNTPGVMAHRHLLI